jgi:hypothetical protein
MLRRSIVAGLAGILLSGCAAPSGKVDSGAAAIEDEGGWMEPARPDPGALSSIGVNPYFNLTPGHQLVLKSDTDSLTITVLNQTRIVDGVETRVVEERETAGGKLAEVSRNYFAISTRNNDLFYFGEEVDTYKDGQVTGHGGAWLAGVNGARPGMMLPGTAAVGMRFYEEMSPGVAMDRSEIVSTSETATTPAGTFTNCVKIAESSALEKGDPEIKLYAPGAGLLSDEDFRLVSYGSVEAGK